MSRKITTYHQACHVAAPETAHGFVVVADESFYCAADFALVAAEIVVVAAEIVVDAAQTVADFAVVAAEIAVAAAQTVADFADAAVEIVVAVLGAAHAIGPLVPEILKKHINE